MVGWDPNSKDVVKRVAFHKAQEDDLFVVHGVVIYGVCYGRPIIGAEIGRQFSKVLGQV
jgi:hypothetical protein